jgi:hypothetical protein
MFYTDARLGHVIDRGIGLSRKMDKIRVFINKWQIHGGGYVRGRC